MERNGEQRSVAISITRDSSLTWITERGSGLALQSVLLEMASPHASAYLDQTETDQYRPFSNLRPIQRNLGIDIAIALAIAINVSAIRYRRVDEPS